MDKKILGVPISYTDSESKRIIYDRVTNQDSDGKVPLAASYNSSSIYIPLEPLFTERVYVYKYFHYSDIMHTIGGISAFLGPFLGLAGPFFVIWFLF